MIYLDANASELLRPEARAAMQAADLLPGNPSSVHRAGRAARALLEDSRSQIAARLGGSARHLIFTSGGTEADALGLHSLGLERRLLYGATEHDAVRSIALAAGAELIPVDKDGVIRLDALEERLRASGPALLALMLANNETGVINPIPEVAALCRAYGALLFIDAVQALGRITFDIRELGADGLAVSGHKIGGPKGVGALLLAQDFPVRPLITGGGQEWGWRGGTQNLPAIAGFAAACAATLPDHLSLREKVAAAAREAGAWVVGEGVQRLPNTLCLILPGVRADAQLISLDLAGFAVSAGAACSSGKVARSHVLEAMGLAEHAGSAIRMSMSWQTNAAQVDAFVGAYRAMAARLSRKAG